MEPKSKEAPSPRHPVPYSFHYDGANYEDCSDELTPDQYVNLILATDGLLDEDGSDADDVMPDTLDDDVSPDSVACNEPDEPEVKHEPKIRFSPLVPNEPVNFLQVTHTDLGDRRITHTQTVPELLVRLPSLDEPVINPVPCDSDLYNKWARLPRGDVIPRSPIRPITVSAKSWAIAQNLQTTSTSDPAASLPPFKPSGINPAEVDCKSLDGIIDHYNQLFPTTPDFTHKPANKAPSQKTKETKFADSEATPTKESSSLNSAPKTKTSPTPAGPIADPPTQLTAVRKPVVQPALHQTGTASIDWPPALKQPDNQLKSNKYWSWRPKVNGHTSKSSRTQAPVQLGKLEPTRKLQHKEHKSKNSSTKNGISINGRLFDALANTGSDVKYRTTLAPGGVNHQSRDSADNDVNSSRGKPGNLRGALFVSGAGGAGGSSLKSGQVKYDMPDLSPVASLDSQGHKEPSAAFDLHPAAQNNFLKRGSNPRGRPTPRQKNKFGGNVEQKSPLDSVLTTRSQQTVRRSSTNDADVPQVQFMDLNDLNLRFSQTVNKTAFRH